MPSVSVIIPNYNHAQYLKQRIDSVLNQTYADFEVIILDDCSTDNSKLVIEQYRSNCKVSSIVYNSENSGSTFKQWDKGIHLAKGEYIWIAESDDWCENNFLETIINGLQKNEETVFGYCQGFCINNKGEIIFQSNHPRLEEYIPKEEFLERFLCYYNSVYNASMAVFKKSYSSQLSDYYKSFRFTGDHVFWAQLSRLGTVYINARPLNYFRKHENDVSGKAYLSGYNFIEEVNMLNYFHKELDLNADLLFKSKVKIYNRFLKSKSKIDLLIRNEIINLLFKNVSFFQKSYFIFIQKLYSFREGLKDKLNTFCF